MSLHKEISFEDEICGHLAANGWFYVKAMRLSMIALVLSFPPT